MKNPAAVSKAHRMAEFIEVTPPFSSALNGGVFRFCFGLTRRDPFEHRRREWAAISEEKPGHEGRAPIDQSTAEAKILPS